MDRFLRSVADDKATEHYGSPDLVISTHGFMHVYYENEQGSPTELDLDHTRLLFTADVSDYGRVRIELDGVHGDKHAQLDEAEFVLSWEGFDIGFGRFYVPVGIERRT